ncbi:hypothetical protein Emag_006748 [Eimeria magna]
MQQLRSASAWPSSSGCLPLSPRIWRIERSSGLVGTRPPLKTHSYYKLHAFQPTSIPTHLASSLLKGRVHSRFPQHMHAVRRMEYLNLNRKDVQAAREARRGFLQLQRSSPGTAGCEPCLSSQGNTKKLVDMLEAASAQSLGGSWISCGLSLPEVLAATTVLNAITAARLSRQVVDCDSAHLYAETLGSSCLEMLVTSAWQLKQPSLSFLSLNRMIQKKHDGGGVLPQLQKEKKSKPSLPLLLPFTVSPESLAAVETQLSSPEAHSTDAVTSPGDSTVILLLLAESQEAAIGLRLLRPFSRDVFLKLMETRPFFDRGPQVSSEEALAWLHFVAAAEVAAGKVNAEGMEVEASKAGQAAATKKNFGEVLLSLLQPAVLQCTDTGGLPVAASVLLEAVGALALLAALRQPTYLAPHQIEPFLLQLLTHAESRLLQHQQRLDLRLSEAPVTANFHESSCCSEGQEQQQQEKGWFYKEERFLLSHKQNEAESILLHNASVVLGLLGWLQRFGTHAAKVASAKVVAPLADCLGKGVSLF